MKERGQSRNSEAARRGSTGPQHAGLELVSVVIPCYNQAHFLKEAIESVLAQSYPHFEVVVVDDGSKDDTSEVAARYPKVRCIRQDNRGVNAARNTGLRHSRGEYLVFLDADDRLLPGALKAGLECFDAHPECAFVAGHCELIAADGTPVGRWRHSRPPHIGRELFLTLLSRKHWVNPGAVMQRRVALEYVGGFDPSIKASEDYELYFRTARRYPVYWHDEAVMEYRLHDTNTTRNSPLMLKGTVAVLRSQRKYVKKDRRYKEAYKAGIRKGRKEYGDPLVEQVRAQMQKGEWERAMRGMLVLLRYYPQGLALLVNGRRRLSQQLKSRSEQLRNRERQLRELRSILKEERRKLGRVRKQNRQLVKSERNLRRQLQEIRESETWRLLQGVNRIRAKALRK